MVDNKQPPWCVGKQQLEPEQAIKLAQSMRRRRSTSISAYKCTACGSWHVGRSTEPRSGK